MAYRFYKYTVDYMESNEQLHVNIFYNLDEMDNFLERHVYQAYWKINM